MQNEDTVRSSIDNLSKNWDIEKAIYDLHLGKRNDVVDTTIKVNQVVFHIPKLSDDNLFVLWKCLWPDCHNCCEKQGRLPLTKDDIYSLSNKMNYESINDFLKQETRISSWNEPGNFGNLITHITMISLKRKENENDEEDGKPIKCRFLDNQGSCKIQDGKPGVCWLYPFASWMESYNNRPLVHATFQFTGDCPGYYLSRTINDMMSILNEYSLKIYNYNMSVNRTTREGFGITNIIY
jgi:Fe-S-cluster containining protein